MSLINVNMLDHDQSELRKYFNYFILVNLLINMIFM